MSKSLWTDPVMEIRVLSMETIVFLESSCLKQEVRMQHCRWPHSMKEEKTFGLYFFLASRMFALLFNKETGP